MEIFGWISFGVIVVFMLFLDLFVFHKKAHEVKRKEALIWSIFWIMVALLFCAGIFIFEGRDKALMFLTGYIIEKSLSMDNLFVIYLIFLYFSIEPKYQHRVLFWGIIGAILTRAFFIFVGLALIKYLHWIIYVFGAFLILTGLKMLIKKEEKVKPEQNIIYRFFKKFFPVTPEVKDQNFFFKKVGLAGKKVTYATPLFLCLLAVESTDIVFAVDSIPAIIAITRDPFIVYTSNIFAILGLRALYFLLASLIQSLRFLKQGLAIILVFLGIKMSFHFDFITPVFSLTFVLSILLIVAILSIIFPYRKN
ncbi:MAG: TerC family protein [Thermoanaerobaculia bacterium]